MNVLYYDCFSGISGDMNLGAMIDLGVAEEHLRSELDKLNLDGWKLITEKDQRHGIYGTKVTVKLTHHEHKHRHLADIEKIIRESALDDKTKNTSMRIFMKVAEAEASVHNISIEKVHFHEVGAIDSIIDIVGAAICYTYLKPDAVFVSPVELGSGFVKCEHGTLPVPAPATAEILKGIPSVKGSVGFEATTPTGAAIIAALGTSFNSSAPIRIKKTGYGVGHKENPALPNLLRVFMAEAEPETTGHFAVQTECNIDDMNPEFFEHISEKLFSAGASDVFISGIIMKKGRPGNVLSVICEPGLADIVRDIIFRESTSVGIRSFVFRKDTLPRKMEVLDTPYGKVTFKRSFLNGKEVSLKPEYEEIRKIAAEKGIPLKEIYNKIIASVVIRDNSKKIDD